MVMIIHNKDIALASQPWLNCCMSLGFFAGSQEKPGYLITLFSEVA